jgi:hypothetical protein
VFGAQRLTRGFGPIAETSLSSHLMPDLNAHKEN